MSKIAANICNIITIKAQNTIEIHKKNCSAHGQDVLLEKNGLKMLI